MSQELCDIFLCGYSELDRVLETSELDTSIRLELHSIQILFYLQKDLLNISFLDYVFSGPLFLCQLTRS